MTCEIIDRSNNIAYVKSENLLIEDSDTALDLMATVKYETNCEKFILDKSSVTEDFFKLSTGIAGEVLQKYVNYNIKLAIVGDYSKYTSKPLKDFIFESNRGKNFFFVETLEEALKKLGQ